MRLLLFEVKRNLKTAPRIYVKSSVTKVIYGSFLANEPETFAGWDKMSRDEIIELKHYINNIKAVARHLGNQSLNELSDYRLRLPLSLSAAIDELSLLCDQSSTELDVFEPMISAIIQTIKIKMVELDDAPKIKAQQILEKLGLAEYKKLDYSHETQAIFSEMLTIHNKSEKLHQQAKKLFDKDKSYSPKAIESMATGESKPTRWLIACAIVVLFEEKPKAIKTTLTDDDLFMLFAKPFLDNDKKDMLSKLVKNYDLGFLAEKIENYKKPDKIES